MPSHTHQIGLSNVGNEGYLPQNNTKLKSIRNGSNIYSPYLNGLVVDRSKNLESTETFNVATGGSKPHNNMPPFTACYYYLRTA